MTTARPTTPQSSDTTGSPGSPLSGVLLMVLSCTVWGLSGMYYKLLDHIPPLEVLCHRTLWSAILFTTVLALQGRLRALPAAMRAPRQAVIISLGALMISINWFVFIWSIHNDRAMEASMGYFLLPLVAVIFGAFFFAERLATGQKLAVGLAAVAIVVLTVGLGVAPWIALVLAGSFGLYSVIKKSLGVGPVVSVTLEVLLLAPVALIVLWSIGWGSFGANLQDSFLLVLSGVLTAVPLILFSAATKRVSLAAIGLVQYLNPTLQFGVATLVFLEPFTIWHAIAFPMVWAALAIYSAVSLGQGRAARKAAKAAATSGTTL